MQAFVYAKDGEFCVLYSVDGEAVDHADGYEDQIDAVEAARRGVYGIGTVHIGLKGAGPWEAL